MATERKKKIHTYYDYTLLFLTVFLLCFGMLMIYSTSSYTAQIKYQDAAYFLKKQAFAITLGVAVMLIVSMVDYRIYMKKLPIIHLRPVTLLYILALVLQVVVLFAGVERNGAKRWLVFAGQSVQPSEISKIATILFVAYLIYLSPKQLDKFIGFIRIVIYLAPLIALIAWENLSTAIVVAGIMAVVCFVASRKKWYFFLAGGGFATLGAAYIFLGEGFRATRFDIWLNVETHDKGYQILQGLYAIASGRIFGTGLGESMQKLGFIPESHNDMIFTIICEELGLFGAVAIILIFILLLWRLFFIAVNAPDLFGSMIAVGVMAHIAIQIIINIAVVTNSIPSTGIPLPFISYGGTSVAILLVEMGIALSVSNRIQYER